MKKNSENGYSVVVIPIVLGVLLLLIAFIFEYGRYVTIKHQLQLTADSSVLAGVSMCRVEYINIKDITETGTVATEDNTKVVLLKEKAFDEAREYLKKNIESLNLKRVEIDEENDIFFTVVDNTLKLELKAEIQGVFATSLFDKDNRLDIVVRAEAEPVDV